MWIRGCAWKSRASRARRPDRRSDRRLALSFITSPRYPVIITFPCPSRGVTSIKRMSPPSGSTEPRRHADLVGLPFRLGDVLGPPVLRSLFGVTVNGPSPPLQSSAPPSGRSAHLPLEFRSPASRVYWCTMEDRLVPHRQLALPDPFSSCCRGRRNLSRSPAVDVGVPRQVDDLHPSFSAGERVDHVRRRDEQDLRQVERDVQVVVAEGEVLLGSSTSSSAATGRPGSRRPPCRSRPA